MPENHSSRRRLPAAVGKISLALGICLCAGQLVATPAATASASAAASTVASASAAAVKPRVTIAARKKRIAWGSAARLTVKVTHPGNGKAVPGGTVRMQISRGNGWRHLVTRTVSAKGTVVLTPKPKKKVRYRAVYGGRSGFTGAASGAVTVTVKPSGAKVLAEARKHTGKPYRYAASGPRAFDCSGYTSYVFRKAAGKSLPRTANAQQRSGKAISRGSARPGDLIVFRNGSHGYHAAIFAGNGYMYDSPKPGLKVAKRKIWSRNYVVRRLV